MYGMRQNNDTACISCKLRAACMPGPGYDDRLLAVLGALRYLPSPTECAFYVPGSAEDKRRALTSPYLWEQKQ